MSVSELVPRPETAPSPALDEHRWLRSLFQPVDISFLPVFRIVFGTTMLWHVVRYYSREMIPFYYNPDAFHFTYYGFGWVRPWPGDGMYVHFFVMGVLAVCIILGLCYRLSAILFFLAFTYQFLLEKALYQNHYYLTCLLAFLMILLPAHRAFSLDVLIRPSLHSHRVPAWMLWLLRAQIGIPYFYGGLAKINADWLRGQPMRIGLLERAHYPLVGQFFTQDWAVWFFAYGGLLLDLFIVPALLWKRTRAVAFVFGVIFHLMNSQLFHIGYFPWFMIFATLVFFPPDWPRRVVQRRGLRPVGNPTAGRPLTSGERAVVAFLGLYMAIQLLVPLRHYLYPGDVSWTEEGHRFAWHMMLRGKTCGMRFYITDPKTGRTGNIDLRPYLTSRQMEKLGKEPDMMVEFCHYLADHLRRSGYGDVEIRALDLVSLNGRKPQLFIDPTVNLAAEPRTWRHYPWVLPLTEPLRWDAWDVPLMEWEKHLELNIPGLPTLSSENQQRPNAGGALQGGEEQRDRAIDP